jgi:hypothetical protein
MADYDDSNNYGIDELVNQALGAVHAGADPDKVNQLFYTEAARRGADISKIKLDLVNDNPDTNGSQKAPKIDKATKAAYKDAVVPETVQDLNTFDYSPSKARGDALSLESPRDVGFVEAATKALNKTQATAATAMAPISYLGAAGTALVSGDDVPSYKEFLKTIGDVREDSAPKEGENYGISGNLGVLAGTLSGELPQFLGVTKAGTATEELPKFVSAGKEFLQKLSTNVAGGATPAVGEAATAYKEAKDAGEDELGALAKAGKAGLEKEAMFVAPASLEGRLGTRVASGAIAGGTLGASQELADTGTITPRELLTSVGTGAAFGALGEGPVEKPAFRPESLPHTDDPAIRAGMKAAEGTKAGKIPDIDDALGEEFTKAREEAWGGKLPDDAQPEKPVEKEPEAPKKSLDDLMKSAENKKQVLDELHTSVDPGNAYGAGTDNSGGIPAEVVGAAKDIASRPGDSINFYEGMKFPNGDDLPLHYEGGRAFAKDTVKPATSSQIQQFVEKNPENWQKQEAASKWFSGQKSAYDALSNLDSYPHEVSQEVKDAAAKMLANPHLKNKLSKVVMKEITPEIAMKSTSGLDHSVRPMLGQDTEGHNYSLGATGVFDSRTNSIRLRGRGFAYGPHGQHGTGDPTTIVHEIMHAATKDLIDGVENGRITDPALVKAHGELTQVRNVIKDHQDKLGEHLTPYQKQQLAYGTTNNNELMSVFYTDKHAQGALKRWTLGGLSLYNRIKNSVLNMLGFKQNEQKKMSDVLFDAGDKFVSHDPNAKQPLMQIPGLEQVQGLAGSAGKTPLGDVPKPRSVGSKLLDAAKNGYDEVKNSDVGMLAREALTSDRLSKDVTNAQRTRQGRMALGEIEAIQSANRLKSITTLENRELVGKALTGDLKSFKALAPEAQSIVREEYKQNVQRSIDIAKEILNIPNRTPLQENIARKILDDAGKYQADAYAAKLFPKRMKEKYASAEEGAKSTNPTAQQQRDLQDLQDARNYVENYWMPSEDRIDSLKADHRDDVYKYLTGVDPDKKFVGFEREERKVAENASIKDALRRITNRSGATEQILKEAMGLTRFQKNSMRQYYNNMRNPSDVFSTRGDIPAALKKLWEPITDPIARNVASIQRQYSYLSNLRAQNQLREEGLKSGIFTEGKGDNTRTEQITGDKMGPLQGLHAAPDVKRALDSVFQTNALTGDLLDAFISDSRGTNAMMNLAGSVLKPAFKYTGIQKALQVIGNGANWVLNAVGSPAQLMATNTLVHPLHTAKGMLDTARLIGTTFRKTLPDDLKDLYKYGIVEYSQIQELHSGGNRKLIEQLLKDAAKKSNPMAAFIHAAGKQGLNTVREAYGAMDFYTKVANWHKEVELWKGVNDRHHLFKDDEALKQFVSRRVNATNITPSHAPKAVRGVEATGITQFATYYAEILRTLKNNGLQSIHDSYLAIKLGDPRLLADAILRGAGTTAAAGWHSKFFGAIAGGAASLMGLNATDLPDDDPRRKYMSKDNFLSSVDPMILTDPQHPEAGEYMFDKTRPDPYAPSTIFLTTGMSGLNKLAHGDKKGAMQDLSNSWNQMLSLRQSNTLWRTVGKVWSADAPRMKKENPALYDYVSSKLTPYMTSKNADRMMDFLEMPLPGSVKNVLYSQRANEALGLKSDVKSPALADTQAAGFTSRFDVKENISSFIAGKAKDDITKAKSNYADLLKQNYDSDPQRLEKGFKDTLKEANDAYETLRSAVQAAKAQGVDNSELTKRLQAAGVSRQMASALRRDLPMNSSFVKSELDRDLKKDLIDSQKDPDARREARIRFRKNNAIIRHMIGEYKHTDIEELD